MANPQKENGYTAISNEILTSLVKACLLGSEYQIIFWIIRQTYGFQKKEDFISLSQFEKETNLSRPTVVKTLKNLIFKKIITKENNKYKFNKDWEKWGSKGVLTSKGVFTIASKGVLTETSKGVLTHKRNKENIQNKQGGLLNKTTSIMYNYVNVDESGNPIGKKRLKRINKDENSELIKVGLLWQSMCSEYLKVEKNEVVMKNIYYPIRSVYDNEKFILKDFKGLFDYFLNDKAIKNDNKMSFDLCMSEKYVAKYKLAKKSNDKPISNAQMAESIKL